MTDLERLELAVRRTYSANENWDTSTLSEFIRCLIINLTELNNFHSTYERDYLEEERGS